MHDILESDEFDDLLNRCEKKQSGLYKIHVSEDDPPQCENLQQENFSVPVSYKNSYIPKIEEALEKSTGMEPKEVFRKRMFMEKNFVDMLEFMLEDTIFNLMEEATFEEFDLTQAPKIYIRKEEAKSKDAQ